MYRSWIDEDIQVSESVSLSLETAGYRVMVARTPQEGLRESKNFQTMLVIMDVVGLEDRVDEVVQSFSPVFFTYSVNYLNRQFSDLEWISEGSSE